MKKSNYIFVVFLFFALYTTAQQNQVELVIEQLPESVAYDIKGGAGCNPGDIVITIKSDIPLLKFDSNIIDIRSVSYDPTKGEYVFCHSKESFWLTVGSYNHISKKTYIDGLKSKYAFRIVEKAAVGQIFFKTKPNNALADFGFAGQSPQLTGVPIEMNAGEYVVRISKHGYLPVDTLIVVPSGGFVREIEINLKPDFATILLDITTTDNSSFIVYPTVEIDTARVNMNYLINNPKARSYDDPDILHYFKLYSNSTIPVPPGSYIIKTSAPGFKSQSSRVFATRGSISTYSTKLEPITGFLTIPDYDNAYDAKVFLDNEFICTIPLHRHKIKIGSHRIVIEKTGYITPESEYTIFCEEGQEVELPVSMSIFKQFRIESIPKGAEIIVDGIRQGFTLYLISLTEGEHDMLIKRNGFMDAKQKFIIKEGLSSDIDSVTFELKKNTPLRIECEERDLEIVITQDDEVVYKGGKTPADVQLPKDLYEMTLTKNNKTAFKGSINHTGEKIFIPAYSYGTFTAMAGDFYPTKPKLYFNDSSHLYNLRGTLLLGRFNLAPILSTSIIKGSLYEINGAFKEKEIDTEIGEGINSNKENTKYPNLIGSVSLMFLNYELKVGVPILRQLDAAFLSTYTFYPKLTKMAAFDHFSGHDLFLGIEVASRISHLNATVKIGQQILFDGEYNLLVGAIKTTVLSDHSKLFLSIPAEMNQFVITVGFTLGQNVHKGNNMLRILKKPIFTKY